MRVRGRALRLGASDRFRVLRPKLSFCWKRWCRGCWGMCAGTGAIHEMGHATSSEGRVVEFSTAFHNRRQIVSDPLNLRAS